LVSACESVAGKSDDAKCLCAEECFFATRGENGHIRAWRRELGKRKERKEFQAPVRDSGEKGACSRFPRVDYPNPR